MFVVFSFAGKQYSGKVGDFFRVDLTEEQNEVSGDVLLTVAENGESTVSGAVKPKVKLRIVEALIKGPKVFAFKKRRRKGYSRKVGHRQKYTKVELVGIA
jgi:large subunit ribosomal protein L21